MSDTLDALDEVLATGALLRATLKEGSEAAGLYDALELAEMLELQSERVLLIKEAEDCCGSESGPMCGSCKSRLDDADYKAKQAQHHWEKAA